MIIILIFLIILEYNKLPYNSFSLSKVGIDELNGSIRINLEGRFKVKKIDILKIDQWTALYYIEDNGFCLDSSSYLNEDNYTRNKISIKDLKYGNINYLDSTCDKKEVDKYKIIDSNKSFKITNKIY